MADYAPMPALSKQSMIAGIHNQIETLIGMTGDIRGKVIELSGASPEPPGPATPHPVPSGELENIHDKLRSIERQLKFILENLNRVI